MAADGNGAGLADWRVGVTARAALAQRAAAAGTWELQLDTGRFLCDAATRSLFGLPDARPVDLAVLARALAPESRARFIAELDDAARGVAILDSEVAVGGGPSGRRWVRSTADLLRDGAGKPHRLLGVSWDNTAAQRLSDKVHDGEERLQITLASIDDGVITTGADGVISFLNPAAEALTGWTSAAARGRHADEVIRLDAPSELAAANPTLACIRENATRRRRAARLTARTGEAREVEITASPMRARLGEVIGAVLVIHDVSEQRELERRLRHAAAHDALTGLPNRGQLEAALAARLGLDPASPARGGAGGQAVGSALCYIDLDQFKIINDTAGHPAGDAFLQRIVAMLRRHVRPGELLARLGGDEFGWILYDSDLAQAQARVNALVQAAAGLRFAWQGQTFSTGLSAGLCALDASATPAEVLSQADLACHAAKAAGRGRLSVYTPDDRLLAARRREMSMAGRLREVIRNNRLTLHAQHIVPATPCADGGAYVELLVRMVEADGSLVPPGAFIPAAERFDLMGEIDRWVVTEALTRLGPRIAAIPGLRIAINLSGNGLNDPDLLEEVLDRVRTSPVPAERITFEVTETAALNNPEAAAAFMGRLRQAGCRIALDDFGVGLSSFAYLKAFPVDCLKIDGSFVRNIASDATDRAIVESINALAHRLGCRTVAEFVEDEAVATLLRGIGVDYLQGYAFGAPQPLLELLFRLA